MYRTRTGGEGRGEAIRRFGEEYALKPYSWPALGRSLSSSLTRPAPCCEFLIRAELHRYLCLLQDHARRTDLVPSVTKLSTVLCCCLATLASGCSKHCYYTILPRDHFSHPRTPSRVSQTSQITAVPQYPQEPPRRTRCKFCSPQPGHSHIRRQGTRESSSVPSRPSVTTCDNE